MLPQLPDQSLSKLALIKASLGYYWISLSRIRAYLIGYILLALFSNGFEVYFALLLEQAAGQQPFPTLFIMTGYWALIILMLITGAIGVWLHLLMFINVNACLHNRLTKASVLYETSLRQFLSYFIASIGLFVLVCLGLTLLIIPGIMLWIRLILWKPLIATNNVTVFSALRRSWQLTYKHDWHIFITGFVTMLLGALTVFLLLGGLVLLCVMMDLIFLHSQWQRITIFIFAFILTYIISAVLLPLYYSFLVVLMNDLKQRT